MIRPQRFAPLRSAPLRSATALLAAALAMSACQTTQTTQPQATTPQTATSGTATSGTGATPAATPTPAKPVAPQPQLTLRPPEPPINDDPDQLLGLDRSGVAALLGNPALIRREDPAEIWQYVINDCVFDVVLYAAGRRYAVSYLEARDDTAAVKEPRPCLNKLLRARQTTPMG